MPTDEQPRTYFYGYHISFDVTGVEPVDHMLKAVADAGRGSHHTKDWKELGLEDEVQRAAERAAQAFRSRDAEVQALRKALAELHADVCHLFGVSEPLPDGGLVAAIALTRLKEVGLGHADRLGRGLNAARTALAGQGENHD